MTKNVLGIAAIALVIAAVGITSYYYFVFDEVDPVTGQKVGFREFLPFGRGGDMRTDDGNGPEGTPGGDLPAGGEDGSPIIVEADIFSKLSQNPVAGMVVYDAAATGTIIRFAERATGHIYEFSTTSKRVARISNTTVPKVRETVWSKTGSSLIMRYLDGDNETVRSYYARIAPKATTTEEAELMELQGAYLSPGMYGVTALPSGRMFYMTESDSGTIGIVSDLNGGKAVEVLRSPIREWVARAVNDDQIALLTRPASYEPGYLYLLNVKSGGLTKVVGGVAGLTATVSPNGKYALYTENQGRGYALKAIEVATGASKSLILPQMESGSGDYKVPLMPDKCVWTKKGTAYCAIPNQAVSRDHIELWHQGIVSESDDIWWIDPATGAIEFVYSPSNEEGIAIDAYKLALSDSETFLAVLNKNDLSLWALDIGFLRKPPQTATTTSPQ